MKSNGSFVWEELAKGPFPRKNFTERMRKQVNRKLDAERPVCRKFNGFAAVIASAAVLTLLLLRFDWQEASTEFHLTNQTAAASRSANAVPAAVNQPIRSVWLLGLRTDATADTQIDTYRTLMIGQENNRVQVVAQGEGILAPYGHQFWKLEMVNVKRSEGFSRYVSAHPADQPAAAAFSNAKPGVVEKLLFVGNRYFSISTAEAAKPNLSTESGARILTREFSKIAGDNTGESPVRLRDILGNPFDGDQWAVTRTTGRWTLQTADSSGRRTALPAVSLPKEVVSHDSLTCSWGEIKRVRPDAVDAVSSPDGDMVAVFTADEVLIYAYAGTLEDQPRLRFPLKTQESMILSQWANANYAADWIGSGKRFLK